ncbi:MAG TPA: hypothetical protein VH395_12605 [Jatrophihabitantaceae bacterium]|jgi:hypothetical protein
MPTQTWEVRIRGEIPHAVLAELGALDVTQEPAQTVLTTLPLDQAGLHGVLERLRNLGLDLIEIRTLHGRDPATPE